MSGLFNPESAFFEFLDQLTDLVLLNILFLLCSLPLVTIGAAFAALHRAAALLAAGEAHPIQGYFTAFRENFRQTTKLWLGFLAISAILSADAFLLLEGLAEVSRAVLVTVAVLYGAMCLVMMYALPMMARYENTTRQILRNAVLICLLHFPKTALMVFLYAVPFALWYFSPKALIFLGVLGFSGPVYLNASILRGIYRQYDSIGEKEVHPDPNPGGIQQGGPGCLGP